MSDLYLSANGARVTAANVSIPYYGLPVADVRLAGDEPLTNPVALVIGNLSLRMAVLRQRPFGGSTSARLVGGAGGWGRAVPARFYRLASGVPLSMILRDVAAEVGETVSLETDRLVGNWYAREAGPAQRVLRQLAGELVWIDAAGVTQVGARATTSIKSPATVSDLDGGAGWVDVATEDVAAWRPGATFSGPSVPGGLTVGAVRIASGSDGTLRLEVLTLDALLATESGAPTAADRSMAALRAIVRAEDPERVAAGIWEYQVERADAATFDGSPTSADFPLPALVGVPYRGALAGASCVPARGTLAYVAFANQDSTRPVLVAFGPTVPEAATLDATGTLALGPSSSSVVLASGSESVSPADAVGRFVRYGDPLTVGAATGVAALPGPTGLVSKVKG